MASGFDWKSLVDQLADVERFPQQRLLSEQNTLEERNNAYGSIVTQLKVLQNSVKALQSPDLFSGRQSVSSDTASAKAAATAGSVQGTFQFAFSRLATAARQVGVANAGKALNTDDDVSQLGLAQAGFSTAITEGSFRVNGAEVKVSSSDTLKGVFDKIAAATGDKVKVMATYDPDVDGIRLESTSPIVLGSATDTSNFLDVARLYNNGSGVITSSGQLGGIRLSSTLGTANFETPLDFGSSGTGTFRINGVEIKYTADDRVDTILRRINDSSAGVSASYDSHSDSFQLANKSSGDVGIALETVSGNFLTATRLTGGALERGEDLIYTINGGSGLRSHSNTITEASSGLSGLSVTALKEGGTAAITVQNDTSKVRDAITSFLDAYNKAQSLIASQTASSTDSSGKVNSNALTADGDADSIASSLRRLAYSPVDGLGLDISHLESLGIVSNSDDDTLTLSDPTKLDDALANHLAGVQNLFTDPKKGLAVQLGAYLEKTAGEEGTLTVKQDLLTRQASGIDVQIADLERIVQEHKDQMTASFVAMEQAQAKINQQLQFLNQRFGTS